MKLLFTEGVGAAQTTTNAQDEKIKIFASESDMLDNINTLDDNEIVATNDATEADLISNILTKVVPTGTILPGMWQQAPTGFLLCDGSEYLKTQYPDLARVLSGAVNAEGSTEYTFKVPDLTGRFLEGSLNVGEYKDAGLPNITGRFAAGGAYPFQSSNNAFSLEGSGNYIIDGITTGYSQANAVKLNAKNGETKTDGTLKTEDEHHVYGNSDTVQPASYTVSYIIKY